jgi:hypothetical protein
MDGTIRLSSVQLDRMFIVRGVTLITHLHQFHKIGRTVPAVVVVSVQRISLFPPEFPLFVAPNKEALQFKFLTGLFIFENRSSK